MLKPIFFVTGAVLALALGACSSKTPSTDSESETEGDADGGTDSAAPSTTDAGTTSTTDSGGGGGGGTKCKELEACCAKLPDPAKSNCEEYVPKGEDYCGNVKDNYCSLDPAACTKLESCCGTLKGDDKTTCTLQVSSYGGNVETCGTALRAWQNKGECQ